MHVMVFVPVIAGFVHVSIPIRLTYHRENRYTSPAGRPSILVPSALSEKKKRGDHRLTTNERSIPVLSEIMVSPLAQPSLSVRTEKVSFKRKAERPTLEWCNTKKKENRETSWSLGEGTFGINWGKYGKE
jgi:hypothetical protein